MNDSAIDLNSPASTSFELSTCQSRLSFDGKRVCIECTDVTACIRSLVAVLYGGVLGSSYLQPFLQSILEKSLDQLKCRPYFVRC